MRAWAAIKVIVGLAAIATVFFVGYMLGSASVAEEIDQVQVRQLASCLPIEDLDALGQCMGLKIVGGE